MIWSAVSSAPSKTSDLAGADIGRRDEELDRLVQARTALEIDEVVEHVAQRVDIERIDVVGARRPENITISVPANAVRSRRRATVEQRRAATPPSCRRG